MNPEEVQQMKAQIAELTARLNRFQMIDKYRFTERPVYIGAFTNDKVGFFGHTAVNQQVAVTAPSGGATIDAQARNAINDTVLRLTNLGLISL